MKKMKKIRKQNRNILLVIPFLLMISACRYAPSAENKTAATSPQSVEEKQSSFERDLETMRTANFEYIFVFRRKDGGAFDDEDRKYLRANRPPEANRFVSSDDGKAFIAGSKFKFPTESLEALQVRFNVEDYSATQEVK